MTTLKPLKRRSRITSGNTRNENCLGRQKNLNIWHRNRSGKTGRGPTMEAPGFCVLQLIGNTTVASTQPRKSPLLFIGVFHWIH